MHRDDDQPPEAVERWGWRFHHLGIPTDKVMPGARALPEHGMFVSGFDSSPYGIEWMRFAPDSPVHDLVRTVAVTPSLVLAHGGGRVQTGRMVGVVMYAVARPRQATSSSFVEASRTHT